LKNPHKPQSSDHVDDLMVSYLEERLSPADRDRVERHLASCHACLSELEDLRNIVAALRENRTAFCPHPRELYELARVDRDPGTLLEAHLIECPACSEELAAYRTGEPVETMSEDLWEKLSDRLPAGVEPKRGGEREPRPKRFRDVVSEWFRIPAVAATAVAAAIILTVMLYPTEAPPTVVGLSHITWDKAPKPKATLEAGAQRAAFIVLFNDFKKIVPQDRIDAVYRALEPDMALMERYQVVSPALFREAVRNKQVNPYDLQNMLEGLRKSLDITIAIVINVSHSDEAVNIECRMIDTASGSTLHSNGAKVANLDDLASVIRRNVMALML